MYVDFEHWYKYDNWDDLGGDYKQVICRESILKHILKITNNGKNNVCPKKSIAKKRYLKNSSISERKRTL